MKLIIDIPEERLNSIKRFGIKQNEVSMFERALISGTPLDDVIEDIKAEINEFAKNPQFGDLDMGATCGAMKCLEIIDKHISGKETE